MQEFRNPIKLGSHTVPGIWRYMLPYEIWQLKIPQERNATCGSCPKIASDGFRPDYRCCTYHPRIPNFLMGLALLDPSTRSKAKEVHAQGWLLPEGFQATPHQWVNFLANVSEERFGKSEDVLCPLLDPKTGNCNIYSYRNSVCSTFFCHTDHGEAGQQFWDAVQTLVMQVELALSQWALSQVGFDLKAYVKRLDALSPKVKKVADPITKRWTETSRKFLWGPDFGRELDIYRECARVVEKERDRLWEIANDTDIIESRHWEKATHRLVPRRYKHEIEDDGGGKDQVTALPADLWNEAQRCFRKLWRVSPHKLKLNHRVKIVRNPHDDAESRSMDHRPHMLLFLSRKGGRQHDWREFITEEEARALEAFAEPTTIGPGIMKHLESLLPATRHPAEFLSEWSCKKVLEENKMVR